MLTQLDERRDVRAESPSWYAIAPGVKLCGVVIGSLTCRTSVTKSAQDARPGDDGRDDREREQRDRARDHGAVPPGQQRPDQDEAGLELDGGPQRAASEPTRIGSSSQRQPIAKSRNRIGPTWPSLTP